MPNGYELLKNAKGEYFVQYKKGHIVIHPAILSFGHDASWIVACVRNNDIREAEVKRFMFVSISKGGATDTINRKNWEYFLEKLPSLGKVELRQLGTEKCL